MKLLIDIFRRVILREMYELLGDCYLHLSGVLKG